MKRAIYQKFTQNKMLRIELFKTDGSKFVEASPFDTYWGAGMNINDPNLTDPEKWPGENILGNLLTDLREHLKEDPEYAGE